MKNYYTENRLREHLESPRNIPTIKPTTEINEIYQKIYEVLFSNRAVTHLASMDRSLSNQWIDNFIEDWKTNGVYMIDTKRVLSEIRKKFNINFQNKELIDYLENIPEEISNLIKNFILIPID